MLDHESAAGKSFVRSLVWERQRLTVSQGKTTTMSKFLACLLLCSPVRQPRLCLLYKPRQSPGGPEGRKGVHRLDRHRSPIVGTKDSKGLLFPLKRLPSSTAPSVRGHKTRFSSANAPFLPAGQVGRNDSVGRSETMNVWSQSTTVNPQSTIASHVPEELQGAEETPHTVHSSTRSSPQTPHRPPRVPRSSAGWTFGPVP